jgi:uncharacterized phage infection (PIP) family protein YhgE
MKQNQRSDYSRDKITPLSPQQVEKMSENVMKTKPVVNEKSASKALKSRHADFVRHRRDLIARYSEAIVNFEEDAMRFKHYAAELDKLQSMLTENFDALEELGEREATFADNSTELSEAHRTAENYRLELIRQNARIAKLIGSENSTVNSGSNNIIHEIASLSFRQLFKLGIGFSLPICLAIFLSALLITLAVIFSMGVW